MSSYNECQFVLSDNLHFAKIYSMIAPQRFTEHNTLKAHFTLISVFLSPDHPARTFYRTERRGEGGTVGPVPCQSGDERSGAPRHSSDAPGEDGAAAPI